MNANRKLMNLQLFAVPNETTTSDLAPAISIDFTSRISENINTLQEILGVTNMTPMAAGTLIKLYKETTTLAAQVAEGETIGLSRSSASSQIRRSLSLASTASRSLLRQSRSTAATWPSTAQTRS